MADDHSIFRQGLKKQIEGEESFAVIGEAANGKEAFDLIKSIMPDLALLDINMPEMNGIEVIKKCIDENIEVSFVILTMYKEEEYFHKAMDLGVRGYILKENTYEELSACIKAVIAGEYYVSPSLSKYMVTRYTTKEELPPCPSPISGLTVTEKRILSLIAEYKTSKEIAEILFVSHRTVENHRSNICHKLGLKGTNKLLQFALRCNSPE